MVRLLIVLAILFGIAFVYLKSILDSGNGRPEEVKVRAIEKAKSAEPLVLQRTEELEKRLQQENPSSR